MEYRALGQVWTCTASLVYEYPRYQQTAPAALARHRVDPGAVVSWQIRCYQREARGDWLCHQAWQRPASPPQQTETQTAGRRTIK